jgi:hypothetical protein
MPVMRVVHLSSGCGRMVVGMVEDAVRIVGPEDVDDSSRRTRPPAWVVAVWVLSAIGLLWVFNQRQEPEPEPEPVEFRTVDSVQGWEPTFESIKKFLPQPQSALGYTWSLVALLSPEFGTIDPGSDVRLVIGGGQGLIAVGSSSRSAAVWTSVDGAIWSRVLDVDDAAGNGYDRWMSAVAFGGPGLVAVGGERSISVGPSGTPIDNDRDDDAAVWTSVDGSVWTRVPHDKDVFGSARLSTVVAGGPGLVAFGDDLQRDGVGVWVSSDGLSWVRVPIDESVFFGATVKNVVAGGPGLVAVGHTGPEDDYDEGSPDEDRDAAVWVSPDGTSWSRVPHDESLFGGQDRVAMYDITVGGPGLVAVGGGDRGAVVWTSDDGLVWVRVTDNESIFSPDQRPVDFGVDQVMLSVAAGAHDLVAVGGSIWSSNDGITWTRFTKGERLSGHRLIAVGPGYFLFNGNEVWTAVPDKQ